MFLPGFHAFYDFLLFDGIVQHIQKINYLHVFIGCFLESVRHPAVGLAAYINKQIAGGNFQNVLCGGLVAVQIDTVVQKHGEVGVSRIVSENLPHPVIFRENSGHDVEMFFGNGLCIGCYHGRRSFGKVFPGRWGRRACGSIIRRAAAGNKARKGQKGSQNKHTFFHRIKTSIILLIKKGCKNNRVSDYTCLKKEYRIPLTGNRFLFNYSVVPYGLPVNLRG